MADDSPPPTASSADAAAEWRPRTSPVLIAISVMLGTFMEVLDTSVANVALPHIAGSLSATPEQATWVLTSYLVSNAIVLPVTAWLSAVFGRKRFLLTCIVIFTLASAACGAATSLEMLILARVVQGDRRRRAPADRPGRSCSRASRRPSAAAAMAAYSMGVIVAPDPRARRSAAGSPTTTPGAGSSTSTCRSASLALLMTQTFIEDPPYLQRTVLRRIDYWRLRLHGPLARHAAGRARQGPAGRLARGGVDPLDAHHLLRSRWWPSSSASSSTDEPIVNLRILGDRNFAIGTVLITAMGIVALRDDRAAPALPPDPARLPGARSRARHQPARPGRAARRHRGGPPRRGPRRAPPGRGRLRLPRPVRNLAVAAHLRRGVVEHRASSPS